jgi:Ca2+-binding RTX toxin-like protein
MNNPVRQERSYRIARWGVYGLTSAAMSLALVSPAGAQQTPGPMIPEDCYYGMGANFVMESNVIVGTEGPDELFGTEGPDIILGLGGDDVINGSGGDDCLVGGEGDDLLNGENGDDILIGSTGRYYDYETAGSSAPAAKVGAASERRKRRVSRGDILRGSLGIDLCDLTDTQGYMFSCEYRSNQDVEH